MEYLYLCGIVNDKKSRREYKYLAGERAEGVASCSLYLQVLKSRKEKRFKNARGIPELVIEDKKIEYKNSNNR